MPVVLPAVHAAVTIGLLQDLVAQATHANDHGVAFLRTGKLSGHNFRNFRRTILRPLRGDFRAVNIPTWGVAKKPRLHAAFQAQGHVIVLFKLAKMEKTGATDVGDCRGDVVGVWRIDNYVELDSDSARRREQIREIGWKNDNNVG